MRAHDLTSRLNAAPAEEPGLIRWKEQLDADLRKRGWANSDGSDLSPDELPLIIETLAGLFGRPRRGRGPRMRESIRPSAACAAHPRSLSATHGYGALPFHVELSHRPRPCRYVILGCVEPGQSEAATVLVNREELGLSADERRFLKDAPILVRTGRRSFYSAILNSDEAFMRYDPACIEPADSRGRLALGMVAERLQEAKPHRHAWRPGGLLIIDNWRVLHAREAVKGSGRELMRMLIDGR